MVVETKVETQKRNYKEITPKFRNEQGLSEAQLTDPDYSIKLIAINAGLDPKKMLVCSKCHHCR